MRMRNLLRGDVQFQWKYGFYFIYVVLVVFYACILSLLSGAVRQTVGIILVYSDPAAMGMFFMGSIVLLEKSERVLHSIAISPVTTHEYILSKVVSIGMISTLVGGIIAVFGSGCTPWLLLAVFLTSALFTLWGLLVGANIRSLNQYIIATVPFEIIGFVPPLIYLFGYHRGIMLFHPGVAAVRLMSGEGSLPLSVATLLIWIALFDWAAYRAVDRMFSRLGGVTL